MTYEKCQFVKNMKWGIIAAGLAVLCIIAAKYPENIPENYMQIEETETNEEKQTEVSTGYYYSQLTEQEQLLYAEILSGLEQYGTDIPVNALDENEFEKIFQCVSNDHPEIFYVDGYTFIKHMKGDKLQDCSFSGCYIYNQEEITQRKNKIEERVTEILANIPSGNEYEKVKYIYEYLITNTEYVPDSIDGQNICSVFLDKKSVCQGYAKAAQYLLRELGIESIFVLGKVENGESHAWNIVRINRKYYHMDVTWGDTSYIIAGEHSGRLPQINYEYLCVPDSWIMKTHTIISDVKLPACSSLDSNYYVREGAYFTETDLLKEATLFKKASDTGYVAIKCADQEIYEEMEKRLITQQEVLQYLKNPRQTIAYIANQGQLAFTFWL